MRSFKAIEGLLQEEKFYEAHQMLLSICQRQRKQKKRESALELLALGGKRFVQVHQYASAFDILDNLLDILIEGEGEGEGVGADEKDGERRFWGDKFCDIIGSIEKEHLNAENFPNPVSVCNKAAKYVE